MHRTPCAIVIAVLLSLGPAATEVVNGSVEGARGQVLYGTLVGIVMDPQRNRVAGATVVIVNTSHGLRRQAATNGQGEYNIVNVQPGTYDVQISVGTTFVFERKGVPLTQGSITRVDAQVPARAAVADASIGDALRVQVGLYAYRAGGQLDAMAATGGPDAFTGYIWSDATLCALTSGGEPTTSSSPRPAIGWRISGRVLSRAADALVVRIEWQRLWDNGDRQPNPRNGTLEATIRLGERFPLDSITSTAGDCSVSGGRLEATVVSRPATARGGGFRSDGGLGTAASVGSRGSRGGRGGGRASAGPATGGDSGVGGTGGASAAGGRASQGGGGTGASTGENSAERAAQALRQRAEQYREVVPLAPGAFQVELWLVQTRPDRTEEIQLITQPLVPSTSFVFPAVRLTSQAGAAEVEVFGFLRRTHGEGAAADLSLQVAIGRSLRQGGSPPAENYSGSGKIVPWPSPTEVLSFELPVSASDKRLLAGHRFDLRLRVTPR